MSQVRIGRPLQLDSVIFSLQSYGGISNYWGRLIEALLGSGRYDLELIMAGEREFKDYRPSWDASVVQVRWSIPVSLARYLPCPGVRGGALFHTSYYRLPASRPRAYLATAYDFMYERYRSGVARVVHTAQKRASLARADAIMCISEFTRGDVREFFPSVSEDRLHVVPLAVDGESFFPDRKDTDCALSNVVLFVGVRGGYKRFELAVEAMRELKEPLRLGIVGPTLTGLEREYLNKVLGQRWEYFGAVSRDRLRELYSAVLALVFPSDCEGFGLPVLEAMACGCPVIAADRASLPEVGGAAALYALEQRGGAYAELIRRVTDDDVRGRMVEAGAKRAAGYSWEEVGRKTMTIYDSFD